MENFNSQSGDTQKKDLNKSTDKSQFGVSAGYDSSVKGDAVKSDVNKDFGSTVSSSSAELPEESKILSAINDLGDMIERLGEKVQGAGMTKIGEGIYRLGDKLEHLKSKKSGDSSTYAKH